LKKIISKKHIPIVLLIVIFVAFIISSDVTIIYESIMKMQFSHLLLAIILWVSGSLIRTVRWHYLLSEFDNRIPFKKNFKYYLAGFSFVISPGRMGEIVRSPYIKRDYGISISKTSSIVFLERFYDLLGLTLILCIGLIMVEFTMTVLLVPAIIIIFAVLVLKNKNKMLKMLKLMSKIKMFKKLDSNVEEVYDSVQKLMKKKLFIFGFSISICTKLLHTVAVYFLITGLGAVISFQEIMVIFPASLFIAAISFIPAGIGILEGGMIGLLTLNGVQYEIAIATTILIRIIGIGLITVIGLYFLKIISKDSQVKNI
jgi:uncharacterized protein (TIRG00374 family)